MESIIPRLVRVTRYDIVAGVVTLGRRLNPPGRDRI